ncbi:hypothetical protein EA658_10675 [Pseudoxanthomonas winnipegensis]|jgi:hypothetical protein|uniref:Anti-sigma factor n=1 Tax=Pseudoxanthomonas winnipegensis TaxID=2480810 RepID=A0ABY1WD66_9GAMM|nr:hypothetical protein [Pseudoxanthomonas winnipegensis]TAA12315.1 hypothetical protein EA659_02975 [Pseudoxanthomonas winnipegensis]TAA19320.1 hypothetical protein EA658_10675 [Pseudoxanthomonas winnipegensis]TAH70580.1 hypothetical protein EA657_17740 [Pseudoxanthomonas winnipegensis]
MNEQHDDDLRFALRTLRQDAAPERDLWPDIAARLEPRSAEQPTHPAPRRQRTRRWQPFALAAALALVAVIGWRLQSGLHPASSAPTPSLAQTPPRAPSHAPLRVEAVRMTRDYQIALERMQGAPMPVALQPALEDLDRSASQVLEAIDHNPRSAQLLQTLRYTYDRRLALTRRAALS